MRECGLEPLQFNWFWAATRLYNALTQSNTYTAKTTTQADSAGMSDIQLTPQLQQCVCFFEPEQNLALFLPSCTDSFL